MRLWFDIESREIITETELEAEFEEVAEDGEHDGITFEEYIWNCQTCYNGSLIEIGNAYLFQHV